LESCQKRPQRAPKAPDNALHLYRRGYTVLPNFA
jgi:hypothetical protein